MSNVHLKKESKLYIQESKQNFNLLLNNIFCCYCVSFYLSHCDYKNTFPLKITLSIYRNHVRLLQISTLNNHDPHMRSFNTEEQGFASICLTVYDPRERCFPSATVCVLRIFRVRVQWPQSLFNIFNKKALIRITTSFL